MNSSEAFLRAALYEECSKSQILKYIDVDSADVQTLRELLNANNLLNIRKIPIILSKFAVKMSLKFAANKFPNLNQIITPDNINVNVESDELEYLLSTTSAYKPSLIFIVSKNIIIGVLGTSIDTFKNTLLETADKLDLTLSNNKKNDKDINNSDDKGKSSSLKNGSSGGIDSTSGNRASGGGNNGNNAETAAQRTSSVKSFKTKNSYSKIAVRSSDTTGQVLLASPPSNFTDTFNSSAGNGNNNKISSVQNGSNNVSRAPSQCSSIKSNNKKRLREYNSDDDEHESVSNKYPKYNNVENGDDYEDYRSNSRNTTNDRYKINNNEQRRERGDGAEVDEEYEDGDADNDEDDYDSQEELLFNDGASYNNSKVGSEKSFKSNNINKVISPLPQSPRLNNLLNHDQHDEVSDRNKRINDFLNNNHQTENPNNDKQLHKTNNDDIEIINLDSGDDISGKPTTTTSTSASNNKINIIENITIQPAHSNKETTKLIDGGSLTNNQHYNNEDDDDDEMYDDDYNDDEVILIKDRDDYEYGYSDNDEVYNLEEEKKTIKSTKLQPSQLKPNALSFDEIVENVKMNGFSTTTATAATTTTTQNNTKTNKKITTAKKRTYNNAADDDDDDVNFTL
jgi:hypothetical protein